MSIQIKTKQGNERFETDHIEDGLIMLLEDFRRKGKEVLDLKVERGTLEQHFAEMAGRTEA